MHTTSKMTVSQLQFFIFHSI